MRRNLIRLLCPFLVIVSSNAVGRAAESSPSDSLTSRLFSHKFSAQLNEQIQVDLLAVSNPVWQTRWQMVNNIQAIDGNARNKPEYWWRPDGKRIEDLSFRRRFRTFGSYHFDFLVRIKGVDDYTVFSGQDAAKLLQTEIQPAVDATRQPIPDLFIIKVRGFPRRGLVEKTTLQVGFAYGPWSLVQGWGGGIDWPKWAKNRDGVLGSACGALIEIPSQVGSDIHIDLAHRLVHEDIRLVAKDEEDRLHVAILENRGTGVGIARKLCVFKNMNLEQLRTITVEKRDYQCVQFPNVVLEPEHVLAWTSYGAIKKQRGRDAPEFRQIKEWKNGGPYRIADLRGKVVLLDFWNFRCGGCIFEMPKLMDLHDRYADEGLVVIGIHADMVDSIAEMDQKLVESKARFWNGRDIPFPVALDGGGITQIKDTPYTSVGATTAAYGVQNFPTKLLINRDGKLIGEFSTDRADYIQQIESLLDEGVERN